MSSSLLSFFVFFPVDLFSNQPSCAGSVASLFGSPQHVGLYRDILFSLFLRHLGSTVGSGAIWYRMGLGVHLWGLCRYIMLVGVRARLYGNAGLLLSVRFQGERVAYDVTEPSQE